MKCSDAKPLVLIRRRLAVNADFSSSARAELVKAIDQIRWKHADESPNCECWTRALAELAIEQGEVKPLRRHDLGRTA